MVLNSLFAALIIVPLGGAIYIIVSRRKYLYFVLLMIILPMLYFISRTPSYMHYFAILVPISALIYGLSINFLWEGTKNNYGKFLAGILFTSILTLNIFFIISFNKFVAERKVIDGDYGSVFPITREFVEDKVKDYRLLKDYELIKSYAYMFAKPEIIHGKLGELFIRGGNANLAIAEFKKALEVNPKDTFSRSNLVYIYTILIFISLNPIYITI